MKLPVQARAVVREGLSGARQGGPLPAIAPAAAGVINCTNPTPNTCICDNGIATCCTNADGCTQQSTGACMCNSAVKS
jgi:hypothetical protein